MKYTSAMSAVFDALRTPSIQVLLLGTTFLLTMLFVHMGVLAEADNALLMALGDVAPSSGWQHDMWRDITAMGSNTVLVFVTLSVAIALSISGEQKKALTFVAAVTLGLAMTFLLKAGIARPRPSEMVHETNVYTQSFPSAHATLSTLVYFYIAYLLTLFSRNTAVRVWVYAVAALLVLCIGLSRIVLGVHWPSDVVAGWCAGGCMAALSFFVIKWKRKLRVKPQKS
ncbi:phosphatase PAP2 family protein [Alteromonas gracilis]|uniref:phosphatase PAP2 family protein n=1 Tax=Alteromonas gracilis TaxID=1479524 RepID=UPI0030D088F1